MIESIPPDIRAAIVAALLAYLATGAAIGLFVVAVSDEIRDADDKPYSMGGLVWLVVFAFMPCWPALLILRSDKP